MTDLKARLQAALEKAADYQLLACLAADARKRDDYGTRAILHRRVSESLRKRIARRESKALTGKIGDSRSPAGPRR